MLSSTTESLEDAAKRPTVNDPANKTGWIAYYTCDGSGCGKHIPHYIYLPCYNAEDVLEYIIGYYETWIPYANSAHLTFHYGVTPPIEVVQIEKERIMEKISSLNSKKEIMQHWLEKLSK